jgi:CCR4-NOT transcription complex subunit 3
MVNKSENDSKEDLQNDETFGSKFSPNSSSHTPNTELESGDEHSTMDDSDSILMASLKNIPHAYDSERPKQYTPLNPYNTPDIFPSKSLLIFNDPGLYEKMDTDTLFFIFYNQQGTYQQYLAAKELKKQAWRYHKKYMTWFQRHDQPQITTNEYELGTYVYFDYETDWCQRIKSGFRFEYEYLEDELPV